MKSLTEQPAVLSVHQGSPGQYILRVADLRYRPLVVGVTKLLGDADSFVVITPSDIKVFSVGNGIGPEVQEPEDSGVPVTDPEMLTAIQSESKEDGPEEVPVVPKARKRGRPVSVAGHDETCQRCAGKGKIQMLLDGGAGAETVCPICKGEGVMRRYGARR